jgi:hypothetical protein
MVNKKRLHSHMLLPWSAQQTNSRTSHC